VLTLCKSGDLTAKNEVSDLTSNEKKILKSIVEELKYLKETYLKKEFNFL